MIIREPPKTSRNIVVELSPDFSQIHCLGSSKRPAVFYSYFRKWPVFCLMKGMLHWTKEVLG